MTPTIDVQCLDTHDPALPLPAYETEDAAGMDLRACLQLEDRETGVMLPAQARLLVPTGLAMAIPPGFEGQIRPRSGLAVRHGITLVNAPGTIDADYRGEIRVLLINLGAETVTLTHGQRIAQIVFAPMARAALKRVDTLSTTDRGTGGFGSTGTG